MNYYYSLSDTAFLLTLGFIAPVICENVEKVETTGHEKQKNISQYLHQIPNADIGVGAFCFLAMVKRFACLLGFVQCCSRESRRKKESGDRRTSSIDLSVQLKDITVRIIHAGGREERYRNEIPASKLLEKYPSMCVATPQVFKHPHDSVLSAEDKLLPGHKYYIIPTTTVEKLKRKHSAKKCEEIESSEGKEVLLDEEVGADSGGDCSEESVCSAKDFYVPRERWSKFLLRKCQRGRNTFVPHIQKPILRRGLGWEPSLSSIQEISP